MLNLIAASMVFIGIHVFISSTPLRGLIIARIGARPYQGGFSLLSAAVLGWMIWAYVNAERQVLWQPSGAVKLVAVVAALSGLWLALTGVMSPNPTTVDQERLLQSAMPAKGIVRITRHPFMVGFALWALAHMLVNGDSASLALFGTFFVLAGLGPWLIDAKKAKAFGADWLAFAAVTSVIPFAAIIGKRNQFRPDEIGWWRPLAAAAIILALLYFHGRLFGAAII